MYIIPTANYEFHKGYASVQNDGCKMGVINYNGDEVIPCEYHYITFGENNIIRAYNKKGFREYNLKK